MQSLFSQSPLIKAEAKSPIKIVYRFSSPYFSLFLDSSIWQLKWTKSIALGIFWRYTKCVTRTYRICLKQVERTLFHSEANSEHNISDNRLKIAHDLLRSSDSVRTDRQPEMWTIIRYEAGDSELPGCRQTKDRRGLQYLNLMKHFFPYHSKWEYDAAGTLGVSTIWNRDARISCMLILPTLNRIGFVQQYLFSCARWMH